MSISYGNNIPLSPSLSSPLCSLFFFLVFIYDSCLQCLIFVLFACSCRFECRKPATLHPVFLFRIWCDYPNAWNILNERPVILDSWEYWEFVLWPAFGLWIWTDFAFMLVLFQDESHFLKNTKTARCQATMPLLKVCKLSAKALIANIRLLGQCCSTYQV